MIASGLQEVNADSLWKLDPTALTQLVVACRLEITATDVQSGSYSMNSL